MRRIPLLLAIGVTATSGAYTIIYLYRWEWNRAMIAGLFFVATEVIIATVLVLDRLRQVESRLDRLSGTGAMAPADAVLERLREHTPERRSHFAWLHEDVDRLGVFLPVLLGAGVVASAAAWVVEHVARVATVPTLERHLARRMALIGLPGHGLLDQEPVEVGDSGGGARRWAVAGAVLVLAASVAAVGLDFLADRIQTRPDPVRPDVETVIELRLRGETALADPERMLGHLWAVCTGPDVFRDRRIPTPEVSHRVDGFARLVVDADLGRHGIDRLVGCLGDVTLAKVQADVGAVHTR